MHFIKDMRSEMSTRLWYCLMNEAHYARRDMTLEEFHAMPDSVLKKIPNFGKRPLAELKELFDKHFGKTRLPNGWHVGMHHTYTDIPALIWHGDDQVFVVPVVSFVHKYGKEKATEVVCEYVKRICRA